MDGPQLKRRGTAAQVIIINFILANADMKNSVRLIIKAHVRARLFATLHGNKMVYYYYILLINALPFINMTNH